MTSKAQGKTKHVVVTQTTVIIIICMLNSIREDDVDHQPRTYNKVADSRRMNIRPYFREIHNY